MGIVNYMYVHATSIYYVDREEHKVYDKTIRKLKFGIVIIQNYIALYVGGRMCWTWVCVPYKICMQYSMASNRENESL